MKFSIFKYSPKPMLLPYFGLRQVSALFSGFFKVLLILFLFLFSSSLQAQSKKELQNKKAQLQKDIEYTNKMLSQTKKNKSASLNQLVTLNKKIRLSVTANKYFFMYDVYAFHDHT